MNRLLKYPLLAILLLAFSGIFMQEDSNIPADDTDTIHNLTENIHECNEYHHAKFEPQQDICVAANNQYSTQSSIRLLKKNKRCYSCTKYYCGALKSGKYVSYYLAYNLLYNKSISNSSLAEPGFQLIRFCRLII